MPTTVKLIAKVSLTTTATSIEISNIPATYTDLAVATSLRTDRSGSNVENCIVEFNGSSASLSSILLIGNGSGASSNSISNAILVVAPGSTAAANTFGNGWIYIPNYAGSANKSLLAEFVTEDNVGAGPLIYAVTGLWANTSAITSLRVKPNSTNSFVSGSSLYLYGITKA